MVFFKRRWSNQQFGATANHLAADGRLGTRGAGFPTRPERLPGENIWSRLAMTRGATLPDVQYSPISRNTSSGQQQHLLRLGRPQTRPQEKATHTSKSKL